MRILYVIPSLTQNGASKELEMLALGQPGAAITVCQLGPASPVSERLEKAGVAVHSLSWTRRFDPAALWRLHGMVRDQRPDVIHVFGRTALRSFALVGRKLLDRVVLSKPFTWHERQPTSALDRWLFRRVGRIVVQGEAEAALARTQGLFLDKIALVPPGIALAASEPAAEETWRDWPRQIVCVGPLERHKGFRNAIWTFDFLRFMFDDLHLVFVGGGPDEGYLRQMARNLRRADCTHFLPACAGGTSAILAQADVCWIPSLRGGGTQATLEAMLAGRAVIACQAPSLAGLIVDGESGFCIAQGDKLDMARRTRQLLLDPALGRQLGARARERALRHFSARAFVERCQRTYLEAAG